MKTKVLFRRYKGTSDIVALFPRLPATPNPAYCLSYMHIGQHGAADPNGCIFMTVPAKPEEYSSLEAQLIRVGYKLKIAKRTTRADYEARKTEINSY